MRPAVVGARVTRSETTSLGLHFLGAIGCGAAMAMVLIGIERNDRNDLLVAAVLFVVGIVSLLVSGLGTEDEVPRS
jgi:hypothetical protein